MNATATSLLASDGFAQPLDLRAPLADVDIADARISIGRFDLSPALGRWRLKEWQHFCFISPTQLVTLAIVDAKFLQLAWVQVVDLLTGARFEHRRQRPAADAHLARSLWDDRSWFESKGFRIGIHSNLSQGAHSVEVEVAASAAGPEVRGVWRCLHNLAAVQPLVVSLPVARNRCAYSHKVPLPAEGVLEVAGVASHWDATGCTAILDIHKGHYPRHTFWRWATFAGRDPAGRAIAVNLTKNVVHDDKRWNENAIWLDGAITKLGPASFAFDLDRRMQPWRISSADGGADLRFEPAGGRVENTEVPGLVRSRFHQLYGRFSGTLRVQGESLAVNDCWGLCEDHDSLW